MKYPEFYEKIYSPRHEPVPASVLGRLKRKLELERQEAVYQLMDGGERFLDVGCGFGHLVFMATQKYREAHGTDISEERIKWNREAAGNLDGVKVDFQVSDMNHGIPFKDGYFDSIACVASLELPSENLAVVHEFNRVLKPGGTLLITISNIAYITRRIRALLGQPPRISAHNNLIDGGVLHYYTLSSVKRLLGNAGFRVVKAGSIGKLWFLRNWWKTLLSAGLVIKAVKTSSVRNKIK